jgi:di/tricarboxylate transporter
VADTISLSIIAFLVLVAAFAIGSFTKINAGLLATVAAFGVGTLLVGMSIKDVIGQFPAGLFFILVGATLLFAIVRINGTIDLLAYWAERLAGDRKILIPILMFLLTAALASAGAFTPRHRDRGPGGLGAGHAVRYQHSGYGLGHRPRR